MNALFWTESFKVRAYEVDIFGKAYVQTIFNYLQEAASNHAGALKADKENLERLNYTWVLSRAHIQMKTYPRWHQTVQIDTWPSKKETYFGVRDFEIKLKDETIGRATSSWMMIDFNQRKPVKLPDFLNGVEYPEKGRALNDPFHRLPELRQVQNELKLKVRYSDLDVNRHVNSGHYLTWAMEAVPVEIRKKYIVKDFQINYRAEALFGDVVSSQIEIIKNENGLALHHRILRESDQKELCRALSLWNPVQS